MKIKIQSSIAILSTMMGIGCGGFGSSGNNFDLFELLLLQNLLFPPAVKEVNECSRPERSDPLLTQGDPLVREQWYLNNTGQSAFASDRGTACEDVWASRSIVSRKLTGSGVKVVVIDEGLEIAHEDLAPNLGTGSINFGGGSDPTLGTNDGDHGTSVAGIIASRSGNNLGGRGIAGRASVIGANYLIPAYQSEANHVNSLGGTTGTNTGAIFNLSYGTSNHQPLAMNSALAIHLSGAGRTTLRNGRGGIYVKSAGNGFLTYGTDAACTGARAIRVSCQNASMDPQNTAVEVIVVGALNAEGKKSSYSTAGSAIWVSAPGGEFGYDRTVVSSTDANVFKPAMITTDQEGCNRGYAKTTDPVNNFVNNSNGQNPGCKYTNTFNGTSSAAPSTSGVIALMLEANPNLTWRDVQFILAKTARKVDPDIAPVVDNSVTGSLVSEPGWITNAAGYNFHNYYGFGAVNADAAVDMAVAYSNHLPAGGLLTETASSGVISVAVPDNSATGITSTLSMSNNRTIEQVQITISATRSTTEGNQDLALELTSPSGTKSVLLTNRNGLGANANLNDTRFRSNAFYGERSAGVWTLRVIDGWAGAPIYTLTNWTLTVHGH
ncbi:MAG: S8 family serine peptidase [Leptospira sp.]|nr:S8 family serine peptidase [Leptospira sp.]